MLSPKIPAKLEFAWRTHRGQVRARNEDAVLVHPEHGIAVIADGIGGASAGDVASRMATEIIGKRLQRQSPSREDPRRALLLIGAAIDEANSAIFELARQRPELSGMGTTVVAGYAGSSWLAYGHVGDSRLYLLRRGELHQLTSDHSFIQEVVDQGFFPTRDDARDYGINENVLTRAVGSTAHVAAATDVVDLAPGDLFLFCTDGLSGMVCRDDLAHLLSAVRGSLETAADALVHLACEAGGIDNITLILMRVTALGEQGA
jgi:protein phosphatase